MINTKNRFWISLFFVNFSSDRASKRISKCVRGGVHIVSQRVGWYAKNIFIAKDCVIVLNLIQGG
jgi:hypothetical protein